MNETATAAIYTHKDPNGWDCLSLILPHKDMGPERQVLLSELTHDIQKIVDQHTQKNGWTHYIR